MRAVIVKNGVVNGVILLDEKTIDVDGKAARGPATYTVEDGGVLTKVHYEAVFRAPKGATLVASETASIGWSYADGEFTSPEPEPVQVPVAPFISDRQFAQQLAIDGIISEHEALAWAARGDLPAALEAIVATLGDQQFPARMLLSAATAYERSHPLTAMLGGLLGYDAEQLDALWVQGSAL